MSEATGWALHLGAMPLGNARTRFAVWAPEQQRVEVELQHSMQRTELAPRGDGTFEVEVADAPVGSDYFYVLGNDRRPDPVSRHQPHGVHGPSRVVDPRAFTWSDAGFRGVSREDLVIYELHVGTFTPRGTFEAAIERLPYLASIGITAVELMPVAEFPGSRNWGYDGVHLYAPQSSYGGPDGLRQFVDACHGVGLAVLLDVVYNHIGPEGNYLGQYGPYFTDRYQTPWGQAVNFDGAGSDGVRRHFVENAKYWIDEFHMDGLRLDAVHAIFDFGADHILRQLAREVHAHARALGRRVSLIAESDLNDVRVTSPTERGGHGLDAQWSDDFHHALHAVLAGNDRGYFRDFGELRQLAKAYSDGFVIDGCESVYRQRRHGSSSRGRPGAEHVVFSQNHDQIANASHGQRHSVLLGAKDEKLALAALIAAPSPLLLFQGQEYGETEAFSFFTSHGDADLVEGVRSGRLAELAAFGLSEHYRDPQDPETFRACVLDPARVEQAPHAQMLALTKDLLALRKRTRALSNARRDLVTVEYDDAQRTLGILRRDPDGSAALITLSFARQAAPCPLPARNTSFERALFTRSSAYGHDAAIAPADAIEPSTSTLMLPPRSAAIYLATRFEEIPD